MVEEYVGAVGHGLPGHEAYAGAVVGARALHHAVAFADLMALLVLWRAARRATRAAKHLAAGASADATEDHIRFWRLANEIATRPLRPLGQPVNASACGRNSRTSSGRARRR